MFQSYDRFFARSSYFILSWSYSLDTGSLTDFWAQFCRECRCGPGQVSIPGTPIPPALWTSSFIPNFLLKRSLALMYHKFVCRLHGHKHHTTWFCRVFLALSPSLPPPFYLSLSLSPCFFLSLCLSLSLSLSLLFSLSVFIYSFLSLSLSLSLSHSLSLSLSVCLSLSLSLSLCFPLHPSTYLSVDLSMNLFICLSVCLSIYMCIRHTYYHFDLFVNPC